MHVGRFAWRYRSFYLLIALLLFFINSSLFKTGDLRYLNGVFFAIVVIFSIYAIGHHHKYIVAPSIVLGLLAVIGLVSEEVALASPAIILAQFSLSFLFSAIITVTFLFYTLNDQRVTADTLYKAVSTYLLMGLTWTYVYALIYFLNPQAFVIPGGPISHVSADVIPRFIYFSFVSLTTLGYGDILPVSGIARTFSWFEAVAGQIYLTVLIAQIVGLYIAKKQH